MRVVYVEPYAKSEAYRLYGDSIECKAIPNPGGKPHSEEAVEFEAFVGVAPRRFADFFGMRQITGRRVERKDKSGRKIKQELEDLKTPRLRLSEFAYLKREEFAIKSVAEIVRKM